jgi:hypothetical protein
MINCPKCGSPFEENEKWGIRKYCSRHCANSKTHSVETKTKIKESLSGRKTTRSALQEDKDVWKEKIKATWLAKYLTTPFEELGSENRRRRVFEEQDYKCNDPSCGISEWKGKPISLELEHKDGDTTNNKRENLEGLCPNCHSVTDTWRGRNKPARNGSVSITDEFLLQCLNDAGNIRQGLLKAGLAAKGNNYARAKKLLGL